MGLYTRPGKSTTDSLRHQTVIAVEQDGRALVSYDQCERSWIKSNLLTAVFLSPFVAVFWYQAIRIRRLKR